jgi:hypothetical protein
MSYILFDSRRVGRQLERFLRVVLEVEGPPYPVQAGRENFRHFAHSGRPVSRLTAELSRVQVAEGQRFATEWFIGTPSPTFHDCSTWP